MTTFCIVPLSWLTAFAFQKYAVAVSSGVRTVPLIIALSHTPALVLMDVQLPGIDGVEARVRLRRDVRTETIPVLALTAQAMHGDRERFLEAGFDGYLSKPMDVAELLRTVEGYCGRE